MQVQIDEAMRLYRHVTTLPNWHAEVGQTPGGNWYISAQHDPWRQFLWRTARGAARDIARIRAESDTEI